MKKLILIASVFLAGCCHKDAVDPVTVVRDCTGTYLRLEGRDYHVCNVAATDRYRHGDKVMASFKMLRSCEEMAGRTICQLYHANEGWINVTSIH
jgi:hypothetical protein